MSSTDCRSAEGVDVGLIDGIIAIVHVLRTVPFSHVDPAVQEALADLREDDDVRFLLGGP